MVLVLVHTSSKSTIFLDAHTRQYQARSVDTTGIQGITNSNTVTSEPSVSHQQVSITGNDSTGHDSRLTPHKSQTSDLKLVARRAKEYYSCDGSGSKLGVGSKGYFTA